MTDHDTTETIIAAVREWQEADAEVDALLGQLYDADGAFFPHKKEELAENLTEAEDREEAAEDVLRALRLPPREETP